MVVRCQFHALPALPNGESTHWIVGCVYSVASLDAPVCCRLRVQRHIAVCSSDPLAYDKRFGICQLVQC